MKTIMKLIFAVLLLAGIAPLAEAQTQPFYTTLSSAVTSGASTTNQFVLTSMTAFTGQWTLAASTASTQNFCIVDHEVAQIAAINTTTLAMTVRRGAGGVATPHASGAIIICGPGGGNFNSGTGGTAGVFLGTAHPTGRCVAANSQFLPVVSTGQPAAVSVLYNCNNGVWAVQTLPDEIASPLVRYCTPPGMQSFSLLTSFNLGTGLNVGTSSTPVAGTQYYASIEIPDTMIITGVSVLNGAVIGTDKVLAALHRSDGVKMANSATAGVTTVGLNAFQDLAFTSAFLATGPARYWIDEQINGTTTRYEAIPNSLTGTGGLFTGILGSSFLGTFGTIQNLASAIAAGANQATSALPAVLVSTAPIGCTY